MKSAVSLALGQGECCVAGIGHESATSLALGPSMPCPGIGHESATALTLGPSMPDVQHRPRATTLM
eukprot:5575778-Alexandrium_andersonii.AAC.1